ncbi:hypothetical protein BDB00DRAFT_961166 [Zychaea mexicana]|uniref:uncharacterized protein n=1 Tax=Zychaea mexicana TaxID=64656 RepID=UPI0022FE8790|nr:uncharacterized protein BDB00DRAFT_961166 [Zychaea mexicana]KAI9490369.1 hypothetical protein BDB00DRAFT_961166 [Zychaea mexicana]
MRIAKNSSNINDFNFFLLYRIDYRTSLTDIVTCKIKYEEGFANIFGHVFTKPEVMWTEADKALVVPTDYSLCIGFSLQTGTLLLLQCFWNYLANSVAKASFMSSKEFMFYIGWTVLSIIMFPIVQYNFSRDIYDPTYKEVFPELIYGCELFVVAVLGVISHFRFKKLLNNSRESNNARSITHKIRYFQELNLLLSIVLFIDSVSFIILSADGLTGRKYLNAHKFSADIFICNINVTSVITWFIVILIFHPKPTSQGTTTTLPAPTQDFLSTGKQFDTYTGSPILMPQGSQASSEFMHYTKSGSVIVPMANQPSYASGTTFQLNPLATIPTTDQNHYYQSSQKNKTMTHSTTPSTATLVSTPATKQQQRKDGGGYSPEDMFAANNNSHNNRPVSTTPPHPALNNNNNAMPALNESNVTAVNHDAASGDWESTVDWPMQHEPITSGTGSVRQQQSNYLQQQQQPYESVRRQKSDDSMWLHQSPRGATNNGGVRSP